MAKVRRQKTWTTGRYLALLWGVTLTLYLLRGLGFITFLPGVIIAGLWGLSLVGSGLYLLQLSRRW